MPRRNGKLFKETPYQKDKIEGIIRDSKGHKFIGAEQVHHDDPFYLRAPLCRECALEIGTPGDDGDIEDYPFEDVLCSRKGCTKKAVIYYHFERRL